MLIESNIFTAKGESGGNQMTYIFQNMKLSDAIAWVVICCKEEMVLVNNACATFAVK